MWPALPASPACVPTPRLPRAPHIGLGLGQGRGYRAKARAADRANTNPNPNPNSSSSPSSNPNQGERRVLRLPSGDPFALTWLAALLGLALSAHITTLASSPAASSVPRYSSPIVLAQIAGTAAVRSGPSAYPAPAPRLPRAYPPRGCGVGAWGMLALSLAFTLALALALTHAGVVSRFSCGVGALPKAPTPRVSASARARSPTLYPDHINLPPGPCSRLANANARLQGRTGELSLAGSPSLSPAPLAPRP